MMLNDAFGFEKVYIACGYSDLRRRIDGFASFLDSFKPLNNYTHEIKIRL